MKSVVARALLQKFLLALLVTVVTGSASRAEFIIDRFDAGTAGPIFETFEALGTYPVFTSTAATGILGGVRKWQVEVTQHSFSRTEIYDGFGGEFGISNGSMQDSEVSIRWDGNNNNAMNGVFAPPVDLTQGMTNDYLFLQITSADLTTAFEVVATDTNGSQAVSKSFLGPSTTNYSFSEFTGIDFSQIVSLQLNISGPSAYDVSVTHFAALSSVPEPSSALLLGICLTGGLLVRRSRKA